MIFNTLTSEQQGLIVRHLELVIEANKTTNLTRIDSLESGMLLHVEDSLSALPEIGDSPNGLFGDLGSGAGYPGIPLAIATERDTVLVDSRLKKAKILDGFISELGLASQISTFSGRAELLARRQPNSFAVLTARALSQLPVLMELASPLLKNGGHLICYKANVDEELEQAQRIQKITGMELISDRAFELGGQIPRRILVFQKVSNPKVKLPRKEGEAQKNPLC